MKKIVFTLFFIVAYLPAWAGIQAKDIDPSEVKTPVPSCQWVKLVEVGATIKPNQIDLEEQGAICTEFASSMQRLPSVQIMRKLSKMTVLVLANSKTKDSAKEVAYQLLNVVEARGNKSDAEVVDSFLTIFQASVETNWRVSPREINVNLRALGSPAKTIDHDGIVKLTKTILQNKKAKGI